MLFFLGRCTFTSFFLLYPYTKGIRKSQVLIGHAKDYFMLTFSPPYPWTRLFCIEVQKGLIKLFLTIRSRIIRRGKLVKTISANSSMEMTFLLCDSFEKSHNNLPEDNSRLGCPD